MMRSLFSGILGLSAHQAEMDVIGNNVANVNTYGFKRGRAVFQDILSQTTGFSTAPTATNGGINATQVGLGVRLASVDNIFTQGALQSTGRANDVAIQGDGFLIFKDGLRDLYTRAGTLDVDADANLIQSGTGFQLMGWSSIEDPYTKDLTIDKSKPIETLNIKSREKLSARATTEVEYRSNLTASADERSLPDSRVMEYTDNQGNRQELTFNFSKIDKNSWNWMAIDDTEGQVGNGILVFDDNGKITSSTGGPLLSFDPDGPAGTDPTLVLQDNNTAGITAASFKPLGAETYAMSQAFTASVLGVPKPVAVESTRLSLLSGAAQPLAIPPVPAFDLTGLDGTQELVISGTDGNGVPVSNQTMTLTDMTTISDVVKFINESFPNSVASYDGNTGKIEIADASPGTKHPLTNLKMAFVDPNPASTVKFPGLATQLPTSFAMDATFWSETVPASGTVQDGVHSITVERIDATPSIEKGTKTNLTRFTTFSELGIGNAANFQVSVDKGPAQTIQGLSSGIPTPSNLPITLSGTPPGNAAAVPPVPVGDYGADFFSIDGINTISWTDADLAAAGVNVGNAAQKRNNFGVFVAKQVNSKMFNTVPMRPDSERVYANYDSVTGNLTLTRFTTGANLISLDVPVGSTMNAQAGFTAKSQANGNPGKTVGDLIDAVNAQVPGARLSIQGDRLVLERTVPGSLYSVSIMDVAGNAPDYNNANADPPPAPILSTRSIGEVLWGTPSPVATAGTDTSYTLTDVFNPVDGTSVTKTYNDFKIGSYIGDPAIGEILLNSNGLQPGTTTITTHGERDASKVYISVPTVNSNEAEFKVQAEGVQITPKLSVALIPGAKHVASTQVYDSLGNAHVVNMTFEKVEPNKWQYAVSLDQDDDLMKRYFETHPIAGDAPTDLELSYAADGTVGSRRGILIFNEFGKIDVDKTSAYNAVNLPDLVKPIQFDPADAKQVTFMPDFNGVTQFDSGFTTAARSQNGYEMGMLSSFEIGSSGVIVGTYTNGFKRDIGQVAVASFTNPGGLEKQSDSMYAASANSGLVQVGAADTGSRGTIQSQTLEMSNVDLSKEFTDMIIAQRGFQANARTITTADQLLQELINLKR